MDFQANQQAIQAIIQNIIVFIDSYSTELISAIVGLFVLTFLIRSFKRNLLISEGRARLVLENFDDKTDKLSKWMSIIALFFLLPAILYIKFAY